MFNEFSNVLNSLLENVVWFLNYVGHTTRNIKQRLFKTTFIQIK